MKLVLKVSAPQTPSDDALVDSQSEACDSDSASAASEKRSVRSKRQQQHDRSDIQEKKVCIFRTLKWTHGKNWQIKQQGSFII